MNRDEFVEVVADVFFECGETLYSKNTEYATQEDVFRNFKRAGMFQHISPQQACWNFNTKHLISIQDMIEGYDPSEISLAQWKEKVGDAINYLVLLYGMVVADSVAMQEEGR